MPSAKCVSTFLSGSRLALPASDAAVLARASPEVSKTKPSSSLYISSPFLRCGVSHRTAKLLAQNAGGPAGRVFGSGNLGERRENFALRRNDPFDGRLCFLRDPMVPCRTCLAVSGRPGSGLGRSSNISYYDINVQPAALAFVRCLSLPRLPPAHHSVNLILSSFDPLRIHCRLSVSPR